MTKFLSAENKALIWQLLMEAGAFANIPESYFTKVKELYEKTLIEISRMTENTLTEKNKFVILEMMKKLPFLKQHLTQRPLEEVKIKIDNEFKNKQEEFINLVNHDKPKDVEFNDNTDEPLDTNVMNNMLQNMMEKRENELNQILETKPVDVSPKPVDVSPKTVDGSSKSTLTTVGDTNCSDYIWTQWADHSNKNLKPESSDKQQKVEKKVSFQNNDYINKLKLIQNKSPESMLNQILTNQELILNKLNKLDALSNNT
jgi:hypothetical protein